MAQAAAEGMDGDHIIEVSRVANAVRNMSPERKAAYFEIMRRTGTPVSYTHLTLPTNREV